MGTMRLCASQKRDDLLYHVVHIYKRPKHFQKDERPVQRIQLFHLEGRKLVTRETKYIWQKASTYKLTIAVASH